MAETAQPRVQAVNSEATRGLPYYEKLKRDLRETLQKKRTLDKNMVNALMLGHLVLLMEPGASRGSNLSS